MWNKKILNNKFLKESLVDNHIIEENGLEKNNNGTSLKERFPAEFKAADGHYVRSRAEVIIDNYLYNNQITHAYEKKVPVEDILYCDFYLPLGKKVYIEYWGREGDQQYDNRKKAKIEIYKKNRLNLIELNDKDIQNLDDILPGKLLRFEIKGYM
ncbi:MAG: hypothetical protein LBP74_08520 [Treponema sp.]|nr:hypothetical protein [Treponema sp.]